MNLKNSTKKTILAMVLGLSLASTAGVTVNALNVDQTETQSTQSGKETAAAQVQSITDTIEDGYDVNSKYGGCGLSCAGCSLKCF